MKLIRLSLRIFKSHIGLTLLLCLEIILSMTTFATLYNNWSWGTQQVRMLYDNDLYCSVYYQGPMMQFDEEGKFTISTADEPNIQSYLESVDGYLGRSYTSYLELETLPDGVTIQMVDDLTAQRMKLPVSSGSWLTDVSLDNGRIPCVVVDTHTFPTAYHVGDVISGSPTQYFRLAEDIQYQRAKNYPELDLEFQVVGVVDRTSALLLNDGSSVSTTTEGVPSLDTVYSRMEPDSVQLLCGPVEGMSQPSYVVRMEYFDPAQVDEAQLHEIAQTLSQYGFCYALPEMAQTTQADFREEFQEVLPLAVTLLIVVLCSLICISLLNARRQLHTFSIYQICGASWLKCIIIYALYFALLYLISCLIFSGYMLLQYSADQEGLFYQYAVTKEFIGISALIFLMVAVLSVLPPFVKAFRQSPVTGYRKKE